MARSIWTVAERELLAPYVADYKAADENSRILLLEHKVIPRFLTEFPPKKDESDSGEAEPAEANLHEAERRLKQKIHGWFIKKVPTTVSLTPRRKPRATGNAEEREVLKHYIELYRKGTEQSRRILVATRALPEYVRQFDRYGDINKLSHEKKSEYKKYVRDWLTIEAYHREQGEQDPEAGLRVTLDPDSGSDGSESASGSPSPSSRRKRRISPSQDDLPITKKPKITANTPTRAAISSTSHHNARSSLSATPSRVVPRSSTPSYDLTGPPSPPETPLPKAHFALTGRRSSRNIVHSTPTTDTSDSEEGSEPDLEAEPEPELDEDDCEGDAQVDVYSEQEHEPEDDLEYVSSPEPDVSIAARMKARPRARNDGSTSSPMQQSKEDQCRKDKDAADRQYEDQEEDVVMQQDDAPIQDDDDMPEKEDLQEDDVELWEQELQDLPEEAQERVVVQQREESQEADYEDRDEKESPRRLSERPVVAPTVIDLTGEDGDESADIGPHVRGVQPPRASNHGQYITGSTSPPLEDILKDALKPFFTRHFTDVVTKAVVRAINHTDHEVPARNKQVNRDGQAGDNEDNWQDQENVNAAITKELEPTQEEIRQLTQTITDMEARSTETFKNWTDELREWWDKTSKSLDRIEARMEQHSTLLRELQNPTNSMASQMNQLSKRAKKISEGFIESGGRKSKSRNARDPTTAATGGAGAASSSASRAQPAAVEILIGRFRKVIGAQATVTYYLARIPGRPIEEAVWLSLEDFARYPNAAIVLAEFLDQAEADGVALTNTQDYVYLRDATLAGWASDGTLHRPET